MDNTKNKGWTKYSIPLHQHDSIIIPKFNSFSRMVEEYERLVSPLTEQLKLYDRWYEITSPILRVAEMHNDVLKGVTAFDTALADRLSLITVSDL